MNSNRKKILWLASWYPNKYDPFDGDFIQRHARAAALHNDIHVIFVKEAEDEGGEEEVINSTGTLTEHLIYFRKKKGVWGKLQKQLTWRKSFMRAAEEYIKKNGRPHLVHVHVPWKAGLIALELKKRLQINFITSEHWGIYDQSLEDNFATKPYPFRQGVVSVLKHSLALCLPSSYLGRCIDKLVYQKKQVLIPNVVDTQLFYYTEKKNSRFTFIHVSNMEPVKNVTGIIDAFSELIASRRLEEAELMLIGDRNDSIKKYTEHTGLLNKSIFITEEVPYVTVAREMQRAHCFILNSKMETFSCVTAEALCCGLPVIARNVGSLPELVNPNNGILLNDQSNNSLLQAMIYVKENYNNYDRQAIAQTAQQRYTYSTISDLFKQLYVTF